MRDLISRFRASFLAKLGRCGRCMRQSLLAALTAWAVFGLGLPIWPDGLARDLIGFSAFALTTLWLLHLTAFAARSLDKTRRGDAQPPLTGSAFAPADLSVEHFGRRRALGVVLRAAGIGVIASVPVLLWPSESFAFCGQCTKNADCGVGFVCRNTAPVNSGKVCNECKRA